MCELDVHGGEAVRFQEEGVLSGAALASLTHAEGLKEPPAGPAAILTQEDFTQEHSTAWVIHGGGGGVQYAQINDRIQR